MTTLVWSGCSVDPNLLLEHLATILLTSEALRSSSVNKYSAYKGSRSSLESSPLRSVQRLLSLFFLCCRRPTNLCLGADLSEYCEHSGRTCFRQPQTLLVYQV